MAVRTGAATDRGRMRPGNEDNFVSQGHLFAVATGSAVIRLARSPPRSPSTPWPHWRTAGRGPRAHGARRPRGAIRRPTARSARRRPTTAPSRAWAPPSPPLENGDTLYLAHVGDSRAYLYRNGQLTRLTHDHSLVQQLVDEGRLTPEEAEHHPQRSIITRALGMDSDVEPDTATYTPRSATACCCAPTGSPAWSTRPTSGACCRSPRPQECAEELIPRANAEGGPDNITVVVIDTDDGPDHRRGHAGPWSSACTLETPSPWAAIRRGEPWPSKPRGRAGRRAAGPRRRIWRRVVAGHHRPGHRARPPSPCRPSWYSRFWVGFQDDVVVIYRGVPGDVAGCRLSRVVERTGIQRAAVRSPPTCRASTVAWTVTAWTRPLRAMPPHLLILALDERGCRPRGHDHELPRRRPPTTPGTKATSTD